MRHRPPLLTRARYWRRHYIALAAAVSLAGCANADFGEVNPLLVSDGIHDWVGPYASGANKASKFDLTDDERQLRDLGYPLIEAPYDRQQWYSVAGEYGVYRPERGRIFDPTLYARRLLKTDERSPSARYAQINDDVRNDLTRMPQFFETASRVLDIDAKRRKSMTYVSALSPDERNNAELRMRENASIVALVREKLVQRAESYRYALERLVIASPERQAAECERIINQMQALLVRYRAPATSWEREQSLASAR